MSSAKILAIAGSTRTDSWNQKLLEFACSKAEAAGASVTRLNLGDYPLPIYNEDLEKGGVPEGLAELHEIFLNHNSLLVASPEYNSSLSPLLKNTIDWVSRPCDGHGSCAAFQGKVAGLLAASPGGLGGIRGLVHLRSIFQNIGTMVVPAQFALPGAFSAFDDAGGLIDAKQIAFLESVVNSLVETADKICS